ncbi:hypothetical protein DYQ94_10775 [Xanthomonas sp. LMG 8993]|nr:hypothetical protein [Xanthomonas sp. LMG 8993]
MRATGSGAASAGTPVTCRLRWAAAARPAIGCPARSDILSDSPPRHIRVPLSANPRPRCCLGHSLSWPWKQWVSDETPFRAQVCESPSPVETSRHSLRATSAAWPVA